MSTQIPTLYLLLAAAIGLFIGLLIASLFATREPRNKQEPPRELVEEGYGEVARLWYSPAGKKMLMEIEGGHYKEFNALSEEQKLKATRLAVLLKDWVVSPVEMPDKVGAGEARQTYVPIVPDRVEEPEELYQPITREPDFAYEPEKVETVEVEEPTNPFFSEEQQEADLVSVLQESLDEEVESPGDEVVSAKADLSITQQISAILDEMLQGTELEDKGIRLWENEDHGVDVWVGDEKFEGIDSVPYPQVRQVIRDAVLRWEQETESQQRIED